MTEWIVTFGWGQVDPRDGTPMCNKFVRVSGGHAEVELKLRARYGEEWAFIYDSEESAGVKKYGLEEVSM